MQDYFNMANLQQSGQGRDSGRLPIGVVNGVPYYTINDYQRALDAQRAQQQQGRMDSISNFSNNMVQATQPLATAGANFGSNLNNAIYNQPGPVTISGAGTIQNNQLNRQFTNGGAQFQPPAPAPMPTVSGAQQETASMIQRPSNPQGMTGGQVPDFASAAMNAQAMNDMSQNSMSMSGYQEPAFVTAARQQQVMNEEGAREQRRVEDMQREQRADAAADRAQIGTTISGVGTIQNGQVYRNDQERIVGMGNMNLPEQATVDPALVSQTNRNNRENPLGASPVDLYSMANDGTAEINRLQQFAGAGDAAITSTGVVNAELAATEARAEADKAAIDAETTAARQAEFDAAQEAEDAAREAEGEAAATAAGTDLNQANQDAYQRNLANILESIDLRKKEAGESYSDLYQQFRDQQAFQSGITDTSGVRGGMARQDQSRQSAAEIGALTDLASQRQRAVDTIEAEKLNAEVEAGRMTSEQFELQKTYNPMWLEGELLAQKYQETGDINDFNEYMTHMAGLLGVEPSLANYDDPDKATAEVSESVKNKINQYIQNPTLLQQITGFGTGALMTGIGTAFTGKALGALGTAYVGKGLTAAFGASAAKAGAVGILAKLGLTGAAAVAGPIVGAVLAGALAIAGISSIVNNIRRSKTGEAAEEAIDNLLVKEKERIMGQGFTEAEADEAIAALRSTLPTAYREE